MGPGNAQEKLDKVRKINDQIRKEKLAAAKPKRASAKDFIKKIQDNGVAPRVDLDANQTFEFPEDLRSNADIGAPFIMFSVQASNEKSVNISLYQPPGISISDGANYTGFDVGRLKGAIGIAKNLAAGEGITDADIFSLGVLAKDKFSGSENVDKITSAAAISAGVASNPYTRTAYESTNVRNFSFSFKLIAQSQAESEVIRKIERTFRKFLYPKRSGAIALSYPPLFNIRFFAPSTKTDKDGGNIVGLNKYMPVIKPSYLTSLETTFNAGANTFHEGTFAPVEVDLNLSFQEERVLVRQDLYATDNDFTEQEGFFKDGVLPSVFKSAEGLKQQSKNLNAAISEAKGAAEEDGT
tara:strand:- start:2486 stop:3547 length:1062 start_codon:yes stop_codon:yes gene_type:complete